MGINTSYLNINMLSKLKDIFLDQGHVRLGDFLNIKNAQSLYDSVLSNHLIEEYVPHRHSYLSTIVHSDALPVGINHILQTITGSLHTVDNSKGIIYTHKDYTLLYDKKKYDGKKYGGKENGSTILVILELTKDWPKKSGGEVVVLKKNKNPLLFTPLWNTLSIIKLSKETEYFIKYINCNSDTKIVHILIQ